MQLDVSADIDIAVASSAWKPWCGIPQWLDTLIYLFEDLSVCQTISQAHIPGSHDSSRTSGPALQQQAVLPKQQPGNDAQSPNPTM
jgi:hypothetical protein